MILNERMRCGSGSLSGRVSTQGGGEFQIQGCGWTIDLLVRPSVSRYDSLVSSFERYENFDLKMIVYRSGCDPAIHDSRNWVFFYFFFFLPFFIRGYWTGRKRLFC